MPSSQNDPTLEPVVFGTAIEVPRHMGMTVLRSWILFLAVLAGCRCEPVMTTPAMSELRVSPAELDFGPVAIGATHTLPVVFSNAGRAALSVSINVTGEFSTTDVELTLEGGEARTVDFTFTPERDGAARLELEGLALVLEGTGLPHCEATTCRASSFDLASRTCVETTLDDGAACQSACLTAAGTCLAGDCVGAATATCDDGNACTIDGCRSDGGCLHAPASAPTRNACEVPVCDPQRGFVYQSVEDGTLCGSPTCSFAKICLNGVCAERPTANAPDDCRYTGVCSIQYNSRSFTCASTRSGRMRCWGDPDVLGRDGGSSLPDFLPGATDAQRPVCAQFKPRWLDSARHLQPDNPLAASGLTEFVDVRTDTRILTGGQQSLRALTPGGAYVRSASGLTAAVILDAGVERLCGVEYFIRDGGALFDNNSPDLQLFTKPVRSCGFAVNPAFAFADGTATNRAGVELADGGVTLVGTGRGPTLFLGAQTRLVFPSLRAGPTWPFTPVQVTEEQGSLCGVSAGGELACMAAIDGTRLSPPASGTWPSTRSSRRSP